MNNATEEIKKDLDYLKLPYLHDNISQLAQEAAKKNLSHLDFFTSAISMEVAKKHGRAAERRIKRAGFPFVKTMEGFRWSHPTKINRDLIKHLFTLNFIEEKRNVAFCALPGLGKTHISIALAHHACMNGYRVCFETANTIIEKLDEAQKNGTFFKTMKTYTAPHLLVIDEIGFLPINQHGSNLLFQVITGRYERGSIIVTTNRAFKDWAEIFNQDRTIASGMLDRLLYHCDAIHIEGSSYRMKDINN